MCGLEFTSPIPSDAELREFYGRYKDLRADPRIVALNAQRNLEVLRNFGLDETSWILDFGSGNGEFVQAAGDRCYGIELSLSDRCPQIFDGTGALPRQRYDFITLWGVLEHLRQPSQVIEELATLLRPEGIMAITTVDAEGAIPYYYKPPEHLTYWTKNSLARLLEPYGLEMLQAQPYEMCQLAEIYIDRLLSRTPSGYKSAVAAGIAQLPSIVTVPTNEILVIAKRR
jgi:SAM-dependent methyltransferase